jgi:hypothetical protein
MPMSGEVGPAADASYSSPHQVTTTFCERLTPCLRRSAPTPSLMRPLSMGWCRFVATTLGPPGIYSLQVTHNEYASATTRATRCVV